MPPRRIAGFELSKEVLPLVHELAGRHGPHSVPTPSIRDLRDIEPIPTDAGLVENTGEVAVHRGHWIAPSEKAFELRVMAVPLGETGQHGPGKQALTPKRHKPPRVEVTRMDGPQPHGAKPTYFPQHHLKEQPSDI